jgi:hypothetical protein
MTSLNRRSLITGLISFAVTAPAIVRAASLMPVKVMDTELSGTAINAIYQAWDFGRQDYSVFATYIYMKDGSLRIKEISMEEFYKRYSND